MKKNKPPAVNKKLLRHVRQVHAHALRRHIIDRACELLIAKQKGARIRERQRLLLRAVSRYLHREAAR